MFPPGHHSDISGNIPAPVSTFIGRVNETAEVRNLLSERRLVTLTGPGGSGKTTLALHVATALQSQYPHGVWLVEFAPLKEPALVGQAVASALALPEHGQQTIDESLGLLLRRKTALLVFDNCEHLTGSIAHLTTSLLAGCPNIRILATSREPLGVPGEVVWTVPVLSLPMSQPWRSPDGARENLEALRRSEAVQLFVDRAKAASHSFTLSAENAQWVGLICRRLDGMPLAIELAAARLPALSTRQIAERLDDRFALLTSRLNVAPPRQRTLEATMAWSHDLLSADEQTLFRRLSVFSGGWTLAAAEAVGGGDGLARERVTDLLANLVDKSLVQVRRLHDEARFSFLETTREYAQAKLVAAGEDHVARKRHLDYFVGWAEGIAPHIVGPKQLEVVREFDTERANLRAAFDWSTGAGLDAASALRLTVALGRYFRVRSLPSEGRHQLSTALAMPGNQARTVLRAKGLIEYAFAAYLQSDFVAMGPLVEEALAIAQELGPEGRFLMAAALDALGEMKTEGPEFAEASAHLEEALAIFRELNDERGIAEMLMQISWSFMRAGQYERAEEQMDESVQRFRAYGEPRLLAMSLAGAGELAMRQGKLAKAQTLLEESLDQYGVNQDRWGVGATLGSLGWLALQQERVQDARAFLRRSIEVRLEIGERGGTAWCLERAAEAHMYEAATWPKAHRSPSYARAVTTWGAAAALRAPLNSSIDPADLPRYEQYLAELREELGDAAFEAAWREGESLPLDDAIEIALTPAVGPEGIAPSHTAASAAQRSTGLSPRELETAVLVAQGMTNREIADAMVVREKTIETYITRILNKLGFNSRVQIATWAVQAKLTDPSSDES